MCSGVAPHAAATLPALHLKPRGVLASAKPTPTVRGAWCLFAREAFSALAATETYGLWVTLDPLRASERALRCVCQAMGHAERLRRLVTMGVLVQLGMSLECCSEGSSFWDDPEDPARTPARAGSHAASQLPCLSRRSDAWCLTCAPLPRFPAQAHASCRHLGTRIFLFGNLFRWPPAGASRSPPPAGWLTKAQAR